MISAGMRAGRRATALMGAALLAVSLVWSLAQAPQGFAQRPSAEGALSPRLAELARPALRSAPRAEQARRLSLPRDGAGSLLRDGDRVLAEVRFEQGAIAGVDDLRSAGAKIVHVSARYQTITVAARPAEMPRLAEVSRVAGVTEVLTPIVSATGFQAAVAPCGAATSEGDLQLRAREARGAFNVDGTGVTVGVLSDSFDRDAGAPTRAAHDVASGDLPGPGSPCGHGTPVGVLQDYSALEANDPPQSDEGRAMTQIVHDLAPGAAIDFATAFTGAPAFADNIRALRNRGAQVIVDDVIYLDEPFFQDGPVAVAANDVTAQGATYFSSAGNSNIIDAGFDVGSYEAPFRNAGSCPFSVPPIPGSQCMDFDPGAGVDSTFDLNVKAGAEVHLAIQWAEPWFGVSTDFDIYLLDESGAHLAKSERRNVITTQKPFESIYWKNETTGAKTVRIAISRFAGLGSPRLKFVQFGSAPPTTAQRETSSAGDDFGPTIFGHSATASAVSVGAVPFFNSSTPESFSSRGPVTHHFGPVTGAEPAAPIAAKTITKPDLAATDGGANTFFGQRVSGVWRFFGTSAAAPHAAAVAALMRHSNPSLSPAQTRAAMASTARPVGSFGPTAVGAGLVDAFGAVANVALPPTVTITDRPAPLIRDRWPQIGFAANRPVSFVCQFSGRPAAPCGSPAFPASRLPDGHQGFVVRATDAAGRSAQSETVTFRVDRTRPRVFFRKRPPRIVRTKHRRARVVFRFRSNEKGVRFVCRVDGGLPRFCRGRLARRFRAGRHVLSVRARDTAGNVTRKPRVHRFRVKRRR